MDSMMCVSRFSSTTPPGCTCAMSPSRAAGSSAAQAARSDAPSRGSCAHDTPSWQKKKSLPDVYELWMPAAIRSGSDDCIADVCVSDKTAPVEATNSRSPRSAMAGPVCNRHRNNNTAAGWWGGGCQQSAKQAPPPSSPSRRS
eukprot:scaffold7609_cov112-Isochrysis_galbana.AAC.5